MGCGCGGKRASNIDYQITVDGKPTHIVKTMAEARVWIAQNVSGRRATVRPVPRQKGA